MVRTAYYPADDIKTPFVRDCKKPQATKLRKSITPGSILIVLAGRFRGRRVVFLKQLTSGLLLVTGPYKVNGVPLRRVNQAYVIPTSTKVDLSGVDVASVDDKFFTRNKKCMKKSEDGTFWERDNELTEEDKTNLQKKKDVNAKVSAALLKNVNKVEHLRKYLQNRFTIRKNMRVHQMRF